MLTERQLEVVLSVVYEFIQSGESVGSRTVSKRYLTGHSAATIRNEMADLEEMGYLAQSHVSSGRMPTTLAYRLYVDTVLQRRQAHENERLEWMNVIGDHRRSIESALSSTSELLSQLSNYVGVAAMTQLKEARFKKVSFIRVDSQNVLIVVELNDGLAHHKVVKLPYDLSQDSLEDLARRINAMSGCLWNEVQERLRGYVKQELGEYADSCRKAIHELDRLLKSAQTTLYTGSMSHLFNLPDFHDLSRLKTLYALIEEEEGLTSVVRDASKEGGVSVLIGDESKLPDMKHCALVLTSFGVGEQRTVFGIIGPKRMDYEKAFTVLDGVLAGFSERISSEERE